MPFALSRRQQAVNCRIWGYQPRWLGPLPELNDVATIEALVKKILAGEVVSPEQHRLIAPGVTLGGARPKALLNIKGHSWVVKFSEPGESFDAPLVEHATLTPAAKAGIRVAETMPLKLSRGHALAIKRFDRKGKLRRHALSAFVALRAAGEVMGYPELAQLLRRKWDVTGAVKNNPMRELFRRMVFNILIDNTDDHEKNHVLLMTDRGTYELAPAFDVLPTGQALGYQQMRVGAQMADSTLTNALSESAQFGLSQNEAQKEVKK